MIDLNMLRKLEVWRKTQAEKEGVELFRILPNQTLHQIVITGPKTREALLQIKGIKDRKFAKYGEDILDILNSTYVEIKKEIDISIKDEKILTEKKEKEALSVSAYLDVMNRHLFDMRGRVKGEVTQFQIRNSAIYFTIKDKENNAILSCFIWQNAYMLSGVELEEGIEIVVTGLPQMYKPTGKLSLNATSIELIGEGALKKAYEKLKKKLEGEGLFSISRKKQLSLYPKRVGLITSREGAVIHDFMNNLGKWGFEIKFINSRVEGVYALRDLRNALRFFKQKIENSNNEKLDALIIIRGGGSLESFQAFNNEVIVREIVSMPIPVITGLGHHEDVPLAALAADYTVSTPTAVTHLLNNSWQQAQHVLTLEQKKVFEKFQYFLDHVNNDVEKASRNITSIFVSYIQHFQKIEQKLKQTYYSLKVLIIEHKAKLKGLNSFIVQAYSHLINKYEIYVKNHWDYINGQFNTACDKRKNQIANIEKNLTFVDPLRQLRLGFSIIKMKNKVIKSKNNIKKGDNVEILLMDGTVLASIDQIDTK